MPHNQQPLIGLTSYLTTNAAGSPQCQVPKAYVTAVQTAGGTPLMIPIGSDLNHLDDLVTRLDGILLTGGGDIDPNYYHGDDHPKISFVSPERDALEFALLEIALAADKPVLAICRGIQVLNVAFGGDLYPHIPDGIENAFKHDWFPGYPRDKLAHKVYILPGSKLHGIFGTEEIQVNSLHHQAIRHIGHGLEGTAFAPDEVVEGLEVKGAGFALGVQWHPECMPGDGLMKNLFRTFVDACRL